MKLNSNFQNLSESYLFAEVGRRVREYQENNPQNKVIRMDIGDVTLPIIEPVARAMQKAVGEMLHPETFHGYGPEQGYQFLRDAIAKNDYAERGIEISANEIFISDGAKCDIGNFTDLMGPDCVVAIPNPVYPVYLESNIIPGRTEENGRIVLLDCDPENDFKPSLPKEDVDVIYLCSPNNPTGTVLNREDLKKWVAIANKMGAVILFDSAYEAFIRDENIPRSIYEIPGARDVAVEIRSDSKTAGFTGLRCGYTVVPSSLKGTFADGSVAPLRKLWLRRQTTKFNGASYIIQRGAEAIYSPEGKSLVRANIDYYLHNAAMLREAFIALGYEATGGENSPYVWIRNKEGLDSWQFFDLLLRKCNISVTPGEGFGSAGQGCIRLTGFNSHENTREAIQRISKLRQ